MLEFPFTLTINGVTVQVKVLRYHATTRDAVQAFVDLELDGWLRLNGAHFQRDGTLRSAQLTPLRNGQRLFIPAVEVLDADLRELLTADMLAAIHQHLKRDIPFSPRLQHKGPSRF
jgi:hypothetical protein